MSDLDQARQRVWDVFDDSKLMDGNEDAFQTALDEFEAALRARDTRIWQTAQKQLDGYEKEIRADQTRQVVGALRAAADGRASEIISPLHAADFIEQEFPQ